MVLGTLAKHSNFNPDDLAVLIDRIHLRYRFFGSAHPHDIGPFLGNGVVFERLCAGRNRGRDRAGPSLFFQIGRRVDDQIIRLGNAPDTMLRAIRFDDPAQVQSMPLHGGCLPQELYGFTMQAQLTIQPSYVRISHFASSRTRADVFAYVPTVVIFARMTAAKMPKLVVLSASAPSVGVN
jgi:hypothetical protein